MFKKVVVADFLAGAIVDEAFASPGSYGALDVLFGVYGYAVQIYADFSGYTDMAIGVALLMGFRTGRWGTSGHRFPTQPPMRPPPSRCGPQCSRQPCAWVWPPCS